MDEWSHHRFDMLEEIRSRAAILSRELYEHHPDAAATFQSKVLNSLLGEYDALPELDLEEGKQALIHGKLQDIRMAAANYVKTHSTNKLKKAEFKSRLDNLLFEYDALVRNKE